MRKGDASERLLALDLVDDVAYLEGRTQLEAHVLHHHVAVQQQQRSAVNLVSPEEVRVGGQRRVQAGDVPDDVLYAPLGSGPRGWGPRGHGGDGPHGPVRSLRLVIGRRAGFCVRRVAADARNFGRRRRCRRSVG